MEERFDQKGNGLSKNKPSSKTEQCVAILEGSKIGGTSREKGYRRKNTGGENRFRGKNEKDQSQTSTRKNPKVRLWKIHVGAVGAKNTPATQNLSREEYQIKRQEGGGGSRSSAKISPEKNEN